MLEESGVSVDSYTSYTHVYVNQGVAKPLLLGTYYDSVNIANNAMHNRSMHLCTYIGNSCTTFQQGTWEIDGVDSHQVGAQGGLSNLSISHVPCFVVLKKPFVPKTR